MSTQAVNRILQNPSENIECSFVIILHIIRSIGGKWRLYNGVDPSCKKKPRLTLIISANSKGYDWQCSSKVAPAITQLMPSIKLVCRRVFHHCFLHIPRYYDGICFFIINPLIVSHASALIDSSISQF